MSQAHDFAGKRVLVTAGTNGMGHAIVALMQACGAQVISTAREASDELPPGVEFVRADLGTTTGTDALAAAILASHGDVDILVNNVGGSTAPGGVWRRSGRHRYTAANM